MKAIKQSEPADTRPVWLRMDLLLFAVCAISLILLVTPWGIGTTPDSVDYISRARAILVGDGPLTVVQNVLAMSGAQRGPLYSILLATGGIVEVDPFVAARWLNALLFAANGAVLLIVLRQSHHSPGLTVAALALFLTALPLLSLHAFAWSEALFLWLGFLGLVSLGFYLEGGAPWLLLLASSALALACLTRYAGVPFIAAGALAIVLSGRQPLWQRFGKAVLFGLVAILPLALWLGWNSLQGETVGNRQLAFHPIGRAHFWQALFTITGWLHLPQATPGVGRLLAGILLLLVAAAALWWWRRTTREASGPFQPFLLLLLLFIPLYLAFLALTISFFDANTPLDDRILAPVYMAGLFLLLAGINELLRLSPNRRWLRLAVGSVVGTAVVVQLAGAVVWIGEQRASGMGYSSPLWLQSETLAAVRELPKDSVLYSNAPEAIELLGEREALPLPRKNDAMRGRVNTAYAAELDDVRRHLQAGAVLIYFNALAGRPVASPEEVTEDLAGLSVYTSGDGVIYSVQPLE